MPRSDENGRELQAVLSYLLNRAIPATELHRALGTARNTYANRSREDSFPNAEELRLLAEHFDLNPVDLQLRFGLISLAHLGSVTPLTPEPTERIPVRGNDTRPCLGTLERRPDGPRL